MTLFTGLDFPASEDFFASLVEVDSLALLDDFAVGADFTTFLTTVFFFEATTEATAFLATFFATPFVVGAFVTVDFLETTPFLSTFFSPTFANFCGGGDSESLFERFLVAIFSDSGLLRRRVVGLGVSSSLECRNFLFLTGTFFFTFLELAVARVYRSPSDEEDDDIDEDEDDEEDEDDSEADEEDDDVTTFFFFITFPLEGPAFTAFAGGLLTVTAFPFFVLATAAFPFLPPFVSTTGLGGSFSFFFATVGFEGLAGFFEEAASLLVFEVGPALLGDLPPPVLPDCFLSLVCFSCFPLTTLEVVGFEPFAPFFEDPKLEDSPSILPAPCEVLDFLWKRVEIFFFWDCAGFATGFAFPIFARFFWGVLYSCLACFLIDGGWASYSASREFFNCAEHV